jgi:hypothetical protein
LSCPGTRFSADHRVPARSCHVPRTPGRTSHVHQPAAHRSATHEPAEPRTMISSDYPGVRPGQGAGRWSPRVPVTRMVPPCIAVPQ